MICNKMRPLNKGLLTKKPSYGKFVRYAKSALRSWYFYFADMEMFEFVQFVRRKWQTVLAFVLSFVLLAFVGSIVQPQKYRAEQRFLVVQTYAEDVDPYAASRSTEYLTNLLSEVMFSQSFMNQALTSGYAIDRNYFPTEAKKLKKAWQKTVQTRVVGDTGILEVYVYHTDRYQAEQLALAIGQVLRTKHGQYHGRGTAVNIQTIDQPIVSLRPVQPDILINTLVGLVLGFIAGLAFVYAFPKRELHVLNSERLVSPKVAPHALAIHSDAVGMFERLTDR